MHRERPLRCEAGAEAALWVATGGSVPAVLGEHMGSCLRCQAEVARHRRTSRQLRALGTQPVAPPPGALEAVLAALDALPDDDVHAARWAAPSMVATAAGAAAGVGVWMWRRRQAG